MDNFALTISVFCINSMKSYIYDSDLYPEVIVIKASKSNYIPINIRFTLKFANEVNNEKRFLEVYEFSFFIKFLEACESLCDLP